MLYKPTKNKNSVLVDLSPMIDVVFLLLIFFMVSTRFVDEHGLDLALPGSKSTQSSQEEMLTVYIDNQGAITLDGESLELDAVQTKIGERLEDYENKSVVFKVDKAVDHGTVISVMDAAKSAGASGITFATVQKNN